MRTTTLAILAAIALGTAAVENASAEPATYNWTGLYVGGQFDYGWGLSKDTRVDANSSFPAGWNFTNANMRGAMGGGQIGFNYQIAQWVFGVEGGYIWGSVKGTGATNYSPFLAGAYNLHTHDFTQIGMITARLGYVWGPSLWYFSAGPAWTRFNILSEAYGPGFGGTAAGNMVRLGWMAGGGIELALTGNWSARLEYNYLDFGTDRLDQPVVMGLMGLRHDVSTQLQLLKVGINYRFKAW